MLPVYWGLYKMTFSCYISLYNEHLCVYIVVIELEAGRLGERHHKLIQLFHCYWMFRLLPTFIRTNNTVKSICTEKVFRAYCLSMNTILKRWEY